MKKIFFLLLTVSLLTACRGLLPVYNVANKTVVVSGTTMREAIIKGSTRKGWSVREVEDGLMEATLMIRRHMVKVAIPYTENSYSIQYDDSENMYFSPKKNRIHRKYNQWVRNLDLAITRAAANTAD